VCGRKVDAASRPRSPDDRDVHTRWAGWIPGPTVAVIGIAEMEPVVGRWNDGFGPVPDTCIVRRDARRTVLSRERTDGSRNRSSGRSCRRPHLRRRRAGLNRRGFDHAWSWRVRNRRVGGQRYATAREHHCDTAQFPHFDTLLEGNSMVPTRPRDKSGLPVGRTIAGSPTVIRGMRSFRAQSVGGSETGPSARWNYRGCGFWRRSLA
jgi:hypothetical protein